MLPADPNVAVRESSALALGLTEREAQERRTQGQGNTTVPPTSRSYLQIARENVFTFINLSLFGLGAALALLGRFSDALISTGVISLNILVSLVQEVRAKRILDHVALLTRPTAAVLRDGRERAAPPDELVVGDVIHVGPGDQIVVDGRVCGDGRMSVDESLLTGETDLLPKRTGDPVYSGTFCVSGSAYYVAEQVGSASLANQMTTSARAFRRVLTPLQREIHLVIRIALLIVVYFEFLLVVMSLLQRANLADSVENSTIVAGLVPNGLFLSIAVAYALGAIRILGYGALVQQSNAIESLSHVDVLCLDKTGTLTANRLRMDGLYPIDTPQADLTRALAAMASSSSGGNKTTEAIAAACPGPRFSVLVEVPFSSARKWSALAFDVPSGNGAQPLRGVYALGAPEMLRPYMAEAHNPSSPEWRRIEDQARDLAGKGLRVLLVAHAPDPLALVDRGDASTLPNGMRPLGLVSLSDELRPEARETLAAFIQAGVQPKIISGDSAETVAALARQAGLSPDLRVVSGTELERMDDDMLASAAESCTIFGRVTPQQKDRLVRALRQRGHYVAMIGDGVNDVLSLKQADLGIAMLSGSQAARGVADLVLMQDSFAVLVPAVREGQRIVNGMQDILKLFLTRISTVGLVILSSLIVGTFPLELRQGSLVTLFSVGIPTVLLAIWAQPGPAATGGLVRRLLHFILPPTLLTSALGLLLFVGVYLLRLLQAGTLVSGATAASRFGDISAAQTTLAIFLGFAGLFLLIFVQPPTAWWTGGDVLSGDWRPTLLALGLMVAFITITLVPPLRTLFALTPLGLQEYALLAGTLTLWVFLVRWTWRHRLLHRFLGVSLNG